MHLLRLRRMLDDEGITGTVRILFNLVRNRVARRRVLEMRNIFRRYEDSLTAVLIIARKPT